MWEQVDYSYEGEHFTVPTPHNVLPKPYGKGHPPIWVACGNPPTFSRAGELGIGAIAFNFEPIFNLRGRIEAYKEGDRELHRAARPVQERQRDDDQLGDLLRDPQGGPRDRAAQGPRLPRDDGEPLPRHDAEVTGRHHLAERPAVAARPRRGRRGGAARRPDRGRLHAVRHARRGVPSRSPRWGDVGWTSWCSACRSRACTTKRCSRCLELFGDKVIPEFDTDRTHSTDRYRATAQPKFARFTNPLPDVEWPTVIPESALVQL